MECLKYNISKTELQKKIGKYLDQNGLPKVLPAKEYKELGVNGLLGFYVMTSTYVLPTEELIDALDTIIGPDSEAIEICCGNGVIGRELCMTLTDSKIQQKDPVIREQYLKLGNPPISYPEDVVEMEALEAARYYKPNTVLACFGTHLWKPGMTGGFQYGVDYEELWKLVPRIILVGNDKVHGENPLMKRRHKEITRYGFLSRTQNSTNKIYIWEK